jgi:23S rRNA pseudouridine1911/1915/1917 synthase
MEIIVTSDYIGKRLDITISELSYGISRSLVKKLVMCGNVLVNGVIINDPSKKIQNACNIVLDTKNLLKPDYEIIAEDIPLNILFEDEHMIVINKMAGIVCHPAPGHRAGTIVNALKFHFGTHLSGGVDCVRPGIVHRLDKDTSGVMLVSKTNEAHDALAAMFANAKGRLMNRHYVCFVFGVPFDKSGRIETLITRHSRFRQQYTTSNEVGKHSITLYRVEKSKYFTSTKAISKIKCELLTGRTHQIRVHMKHISHHIIGDPIYGKTKIETTYPDIVRCFQRQALHSSELSFMHPFSKEYLNFKTPLPEDMQMLEDLL